MAWNELSNTDILNAKDDWLENYSTSMGWEEYWANNLWYGVQRRDKQRNYQRNHDIVYNSGKTKGKSLNVSYDLNTYEPDITLNSSGYLIMNWDE